MSIFNNKSITTRVLVSAACATVLAATCAPAMASDDNTVPTTVEVHYSDLNLATNQGVTTLNRRLQQAAHQACVALLDEPAGLAGRMAYNDCRHAAMNKANQQVALLTKGQHLADR